MLILSSDQIRQALAMPVAIRAVRSAYQALSSPRTIIPDRLHINIDDHIETMLIMPGHLGTQPPAIGLKLLTIAHGNPARGLPLISGTILLLDEQTGVPIAMLDGSSITALRTGASVGLAADHLAKKSATTTAVIGAGIQARSALEAVSCVRTLTAATVFDINTEAAQQFAADMEQLLSIPIVTSGTAASAVKGADIILCATTSEQPVIAGSDVNPGTFVASIGSYRPTMRELGEDTLNRAHRVIVDTRAGCLHEAGDFVVPIQAGRMTNAIVSGDMHELITGSCPGRNNDQEITVYKAVGHAALDLAAARAALAQARDLGLGTDIRV